MSTRVAFPFLVLSDSAISVQDWVIGDPDLPLEPVASILNNWDYARDLEVAVTVAIDWQVAAAELGVAPGELKLRIALVAGTGSGSIPRRQMRLHEAALDIFSDPEIGVSAKIAGSSLSGRLRLWVQVSLDDEPRSASPLSPSRRGARLWSNQVDILLEDGGASRFPMESGSFSAMFAGKPYASAPWFVHWKPSSLQADFSSAVRLYLNSDNPLLLARFKEGDKATLQAIMSDVVSQMIEAALSDDDLASIFDQCDSGSVGQQIANWLLLCFPNHDLPAVKRMFQLFPGEFRASILAGIEVGDH